MRFGPTPPNALWSRHREIGPNERDHLRSSHDIMASGRLALSSIPRYTPQSSSTVASLTDPLTPLSLIAIRNALKDQKTLPVDPAEKHAAVLVPLCNVGGRPGVLFEVRAKLRTHSGEVRYVLLG